MLFIHTHQVKSGKSKQKNYHQDSVPFEHSMHRVLHKRSNTTANFPKHQKIQEKATFTLLHMYFGLILANQNKKKQNQDTKYRVLHDKSNNTASFPEDLKFQEKVTFTHVPWVNSSKSKYKTKISTLYILKLLHTGCSTKEVILLLLSGST